MLAAGRNREGLTLLQIEYCVEVWSVLCRAAPMAMDVRSAHRHRSRTRFSERTGTVILGADAYPGNGADANSRMSTLACLAHEIAHVERYGAGYQRPFELPDVLIDEAETSLRACFLALLRAKDREDLVEDARDRLIAWLSYRREQESTHRNRT
jgi:hypothetical protein